jgi:hypothetical protein
LAATPSTPVPRLLPSGTVPAMRPYVVRRLRPQLLIPVGALAALVVVAVVAFDFSPVFIALAAVVTAVNLWQGSVVLRIDGAGIRFTHGRRGRFIPWNAVQDVSATADELAVHMRDGTARIRLPGLDGDAVTEAVRLNRR